MEIKILIFLFVFSLVRGTCVFTSGYNMSDYAGHAAQKYGGSIEPVIYLGFILAGKELVLQGLRRDFQIGDNLRADITSRA